MSTEGGQNQDERKAAEVFCLSKDGRTAAAFFVCAQEGISGLLPKMRDALASALQDYHAATGETTVLTSGRRSLRHCAALMADFDQRQLEGMYCRHGYPSYIRQLVDAMTRLGRKLTGDEAYDILRNRDEGYISWHLLGAAADIAAPVDHPDLLRNLLLDNNFRVLDEQELGIPCYHVTLQGIQPTIVRE